MFQILPAYLPLNDLKLLGRASTSPWLGVLLEAAGMSASSQPEGIGVMIMKIIGRTSNPSIIGRYIHLAESAFAANSLALKLQSARCETGAAATCKPRQLQ